MRTETDPHLRLYLLDPEGEAPPLLLPGQDTARINTDMACSADGRRIVFSSRAVKPPAGKE
jgi:hypothetical protein